jgi:hypothetical protein
MEKQMRGCLGVVATVTLTLAAMASASIGQAANWLQFGYDPRHSGTNPEEKGYSTAANALLYKVPLQAIPSSGVLHTEAAPVYLENVATSGGNKDLLFVAASYLELPQTAVLLAIDAATGVTLWSQTPPGNFYYMRASPAIDPGLDYVYFAGFDGKVHKYAVSDGTEVVDAHWPEVSTLKPTAEGSSAPLTFAVNGAGKKYLYAPTSAFYDGGDSQGHVTAINLVTGTQNVFNTQCSYLITHLVKDGTPKVDDCDLDGPGTTSGRGQVSSIWGRGGVVYDAATDRIYFATGNGLFDANQANGFEWGDSVLALLPNGTGNGSGWPADSYTPQTYLTLEMQDIDLGSASPVMLPSTSAMYPHLAIQAGKDGCIRMLNLDNLSGAGSASHVGGELNSASACSLLMLIRGIHPTVWSSTNLACPVCLAYGQLSTAVGVPFTQTVSSIRSEEPSHAVIGAWSMLSMPLVEI